MATEFTWAVHTLDSDPDTGIISTAHWTLMGVDGEYSGGAYGSVNIPPAPEGAVLTPYEDVTEADVLGWLDYTDLDKAEKEAGTDAPPSVTENRTVSPSPRTSVPSSTSPPIRNTSVAAGGSAMI